MILKIEENRKRKRGHTITESHDLSHLCLSELDDILHRPCDDRRRQRAYDETKCEEPLEEEGKKITLTFGSFIGDKYLDSQQPPRRPWKITTRFKCCKKAHFTKLPRQILKVLT